MVIHSPYTTWDYNTLDNHLSARAVPTNLTTGGGLPTWHLAMAATLMIMVPPVLVVVFMQRWFVRGLINTDKYARRERFAIQGRGSSQTASRERPAVHQRPGPRR